MKKLLTGLILTLLLTPQLRADEGMWMLPYIEKLNQKDMRKAGAKLSASDIYDAQKSSLKDAIVHFGGGCTGEVVSAEGLVFTNHHCGYASIQKVSTVENDYLKNGFWAMQRGEEIHCPGLTVKFIRHIIDITDRVAKAVENIEDDVDPTQAKRIKTSAIKNIIEEYETEYEGADVQLAQMLGDSKQILFVTETYRDIRLVGTPPSSIGKFGGETDNWMWPRHTGDFSIFRIYADKDGRPAEYSRDNVPLSTPKFLEISAKGYKEGDFSMIIGFPGSTQRYMTSYELDKRMHVDNAARIFIRGVRQNILKKRMESSDKIRLQYSAKYASSSNYWKNSIGMNQALEKHGIKAKKEAFEKEFQAWADKNGNEYANVLPDIKRSVYGAWNTNRANIYLQEGIGRAIEIVSFANTVGRSQYATNGKPKTSEELIEMGDNFYKDYDVETDRAVASAMLRIMRDSLPAEYRPSFFKDEVEAKYAGDIEAYLDDLYAKSVFRSKETFEKFVADGATEETFASDPAAIARSSYMDALKKAQKDAADENAILSESQKKFIRGTLAMNPDKTYYPDANSTIRFTYGNIKPYKPKDGVSYNYYTTLSGVMQKENPEVYEFIVPEKLKQLYRDKDFGGYDVNGEIPVCFISTNDITGGNSGSPMLDAKGRLIGLAFDGNWEALSGDIMFDQQMQRCIGVDVRYVLFIIDKFAGSPIMNELRIVK